ncbi:MAG: hypothetical protein EHM28_10140, partial [Spirochaetaceae bacterium]
MSGKIFTVIALCSFLMAVFAIICLALQFSGSGAISGISMGLSAIGMMGIFLFLQKQKQNVVAENEDKITITEAEKCPIPGTLSVVETSLSAANGQHNPESIPKESPSSSELLEYKLKFRKMQTALGKLGEMFSLGEINPETARQEADALIRNMTFITESTKKAFDIADNLSLSAKNAFMVSENVQTGIKAVTEALKDALAYATQLFEKSQTIHGIIEMLSDIASRINILSINASIVSARAGVQGRPFEVVAKEIRKLAVATDMSLNKISEQISTIVSTISDVVEKINIANTQTDQEKDALLSVVGSLQGITLGV